MNINAPINVNPQQVSQWALEFLDTCELRGRDAERFGICRAFLGALAVGAVTVVAAQQVAAAAETRPPAPELNGATPANGAVVESPST